MATVVCLDFRSGSTCDVPPGSRRTAAGTRGGGRRRPPLVYFWCMTRTNIDLDDVACRAVMDRFQLSTKRDAVNFALRTIAAERLDVEGARALRGSGWEGDLEQLRAGRAS